MASEHDEEMHLSKKLYVGNLPFTTTEADLRRLFEPHGGVASINVVMDRETGRPRGFAFVEMNDESGASAAIQTLNGRELGGRALKVNDANDRPAAGRGGFGRGRR